MEAPINDIIKLILERKREIRNNRAIKGENGKIEGKKKSITINGHTFIVSC